MICADGSPPLSEAESEEAPPAYLREQGRVSVPQPGTNSGEEGNAAGSHTVTQGCLARKSVARAAGTSWHRWSRAPRVLCACSPRVPLGVRDEPRYRPDDVEDRRFLCGIARSRDCPERSAKTSSGRRALLSGAAASRERGGHGVYGEVGR